MCWLFGVGGVVFRVCVCSVRWLLLLDSVFVVVCCALFVVVRRLLCGVRCSLYVFRCALYVGCCLLIVVRCSFCLLFDCCVLRVV